MTLSETAKLALSRGVEVRLNAAGDGLLLETDGDPPADLVELLQAAKPELVGRLRERRRLLEAAEAARPPDVTDGQWRAAMRGLEVFLAASHSDEAERLGWPKDELYRVPPLWARVDLCGAGLLIGDSQVTEVTPTEIRIKTASGASQTFYREPPPDLAMIYRDRLKRTRCDSAAGDEEAALRAREYTIAAYRSYCAHRGRACTLEEAAAAVRGAIATKESRHD